MGNTRSKIKSGSRGKGNNTGLNSNGMSGGQVEEYEDVELMLLRRAIKKDPDSFILNNLMMCVQFFENYEEDIIQIKETLTSSYEAKLNKMLPPQKHILLPDVLQECVAHNVGFTSMRQTFRSTIEPLQPVRIFVVHDNIDVTEQHNPPEYSSVNNAITYNMLVKPSDHQGYVQLQLLDETPFLRGSIKEEDIDPSSIAEDDDEIYSDGDSIYGPKPNSKLIIPRQIKRDSHQSSKIPNTRSLPNLHDDEIIYEDQVSLSRENIYGVRSTRDIKADSDYEHRSSMEERRSHGKRIWSKNELAARRGSYQRHIKHNSIKSNGHWINGRSPASSTSSGYRSGNYALDSDSDCSCHTTRTVSVMSNRRMNFDAETTCDTPQGYTGKTSTGAESTEIYSMSNAKIPRRCFKKVILTREGKIYDPREERKQPQNSKQRRLRMAMRRRNYEVFYTSSIEFMKHFINLFVEELAQPLGFDREDLDDVKPEGAVIYCDKVMVSHNSRHCRIESYEITPTIWLQWPECAQEWLDRPRSTWPNYNDVGKVKDFGCYVVPEGFTPKKGMNPFQELEWQLMFPAAERYLETCMTHSQVQVYLIALMLHKTFIRPVFDTMFGLTTSHIRNKLFWLIEEDDRPSKWPDNRTGERLIKLLNSLYHCISQNEPTLPDYFVRDKNVFQRVPSDHLLHTQKQLKRIMENPIMYVFHAMENIRHSEKFFPRLDYEMLLKILTVDTLALVNPALGQHMFLQSSRTMEESHMVREELYNKSGGFWDNAKVRTSQQKIYNTRVVTNRTLISPRKAMDSIIEISIRCAELEGPRLGALLDFFVRHFIKMAERCQQYGAYQQKNIYLDQADRLSIILSELIRYKDDAKAYRDKIHALRMRATNGRSQNEPPETPKRNLEVPLFTGTLKDRFARETADVLVKSSRNEEAHSSHGNRMGNAEKAIIHDIRVKGEENIHMKIAKSTTGIEHASTSKKPQSKDQSNKSTSGTIPRMVSLADNQNESFLTETTYI